MCCLASSLQRLSTLQGSVYVTTSLLCLFFCCMNKSSKLQRLGDSDSWIKKKEKPVQYLLKIFNDYSAGRSQDHITTPYQPDSSSNPSSTTSSTPSSPAPPLPSSATPPSPLHPSPQSARQQKQFNLTGVHIYMLTIYANLAKICFSQEKKNGVALYDKTTNKVSLSVFLFHSI